jgi:hypothetical protein
MTGRGLFSTSSFPLLQLVDLLLGGRCAVLSAALLFLLTGERVGSLGTTPFLLLLCLDGGSCNRRTQDFLLEGSNDLPLVLAQRCLAVGDALSEALRHGGGTLQRGRIAV